MDTGYWILAMRIFRDTKCVAYGSYTYAVYVHIWRYPIPPGAPAAKEGVTSWRERRVTASAVPRAPNEDNNESFLIF